MKKEADHLRVNWRWSRTYRGGGSSDGPERSDPVHGEGVGTGLETEDIVGRDGEESDPG